LLEVAVEWFTAVTDAIGPAMEDRVRKLASAPTVLAAIGAMGHELVNIDDAEQRTSKASALVRKLRTVDWNRGKNWEGMNEGSARSRVTGTIDRAVRERGIAQKPD